YFWVWALFGLVALFGIYRMLRATHDDRDLAAIIWFNFSAVVMGVAMMATLFPWIVPNTWTIFNAASPQVSLTTFTLTMAGFIPVMLMYNWYQIWVFRARISKLVDYHH
ncbi:cytochrome d ubiquinol oxidase subunit II, partial [Thioclava sp. BHET1]